MIRSTANQAAPKNGRQFRCLVFARISTIHQNAQSLEDQVARCREWLAARIGDRFVLEVNQSQGSGERLDRQELRDLEDAIETDAYDILIAEDLARICRRHAAVSIVELALDHDTRVIAVNDNLDTDYEDWRLKAGFATLHHEFSNADTSKRIRRSLRARFSAGQIVQCLPYGYIKPRPGATDQEVTKDPDAEPVILEIVKRLESGASYSEVVDWLRDEKVPTGRHVSSKRWTVSLLTSLIHNPLLKGVRVRNRRMSKRINKTGRRISVKAPPEELLERECPHLAFIDSERYDRLIQMLDAKNACYRRKGRHGRDTRANVAKKRTRFPGQQVYCGVCNHPFVWGGHGQMNHMMCKGAKDYHCWQGATFDGEVAAWKIRAAVFEQIAALPDFDAALVDQVSREYAELVDSRRSEMERVEKEITATQRKLDNLVNFITQGNASETIGAKMAELEQQLAGLNQQKSFLESRPVHAPELPAMDEIRELGREAIQRQAEDPYALSRLMRTLVPRIVAHPVRLCDGGAILLRASCELKLTAAFPDLAEIPSAREILTVPLQVDLFDPVQRAEYREAVVQLSGQRMKQRDIAAQLGITQTAVQNALKLQRRMEKLGLDSPYIPVHEPPEDLKKMCRHKHPRYRFRPASDEPLNQT